MTTRRLLSALAITAFGCSGTPSDPPVERPILEDPPALAAPPAPLKGRPNLDGRSFPDRVIAMTWDDGPDVDTVKLAAFLRRERVSATFFVVSEWTSHLSSDPGWGAHVFETGHAYLPVLGDLIRLGHRVGNHTRNHVLLSSADAATVDEQLRENQELLDPVILDELRLFRAPGGAWNASAAEIVERDPTLARLVGPIAWDIDHKDWDSSVSCRSSIPAVECERAGPSGRLRVKASVVAQRYLDAIEETGRGVVLLHDRVGHVGSGYALKIARELIPKLKARGFVFAAPVLRFSPLSVRSTGRWEAQGTASIRLGDVDGDGRADVCERGLLGVACARADLRAGMASDRLPRAAFLDALPWRGSLPDGAVWSLADVTGDGRADLCARGDEGIVCAAAGGDGAFGEPRGWSASGLRAKGDLVVDFSDEEDLCDDAIRFGDLDGDGKADVCERGPLGVTCARSLGAGFDQATRWLADLDEREGSTMDLADVDGDGRADLCERREDGLACAPSLGDHFGPLRRWSQGGDFTRADGVRFGDLNGDGRADVCGRAAEGIVCALSAGRAFTRSTVWLEGARSFDSFELGDINGDGRADLCGRGAEGIVCGVAP